MLSLGVNLNAGLGRSSVDDGNTEKGRLEVSGDLRLHRSRLLELRRGVREEPCDIAIGRKEEPVLRRKKGNLGI